MNLHNDLQKVKIPHSCANCRRKCGNRTSACDSFYPENMTEFMDHTLDRLRETVTPSKERTLKRHITRDRKSYDDGVTTLDGYYVQLINSALAQIRKGKEDYVFSFEQIKDIMRFEPDISARYISGAGAYEIRRKTE